MRRSRACRATGVMIGAMAAGLLASSPTWAQNAIPLFSGGKWATYAVNPLPATPPPPALGPAQLVCLDAGSPPFCPTSAILYGFKGTGWLAKTSRAGICGEANWVWAPRGKGSTPHASLAVYYFSRTVSLTGPPTGKAILSVAVDDYAEVWVNGASVGALGSTTVFASAAAAQSSFHGVDITAYLVKGPNVITIKAQNGDASLAGCAGSAVGCTYQQNPAGVIFCGFIPQ